MTNKKIDWYAQRYIERFGFHLVPIEPGRKYPKTKDWGNSTFTDPEHAADFYRKNPDWNIGVALGPSQLCSLDIDCDASFQVILDEFGITPDQLEKYPAIQGRDKGHRIMFRVPEGVNLPYVKLNWPSRNDPTGDKHRAAMAAAKAAKDSGDIEREERIRKVARRWAQYTVMELRAADGKQRQDVLPPSIHPDTGKPYKWISQPKEDWPEPPKWLLTIWSEWERFKPQVKAMCPWLAEDSDIVADIPKRVQTQPAPQQGSAIQAFNDAHDLRAMLEQYGYERRGSRYLSPHSSTQLPGVVLFKDGNRCWIHHASDPLCSEENGTPVNAFDLFCYYEHSGDVRAAVKTAAKLLGLESPPIQQNAPAQIPETVSRETSEIDSGYRDYMSPLPWVSDKGAPMKHIDNLYEICRRLGVTIRYNVIKKDEEIIIPTERFSKDNQANASLAWLVSECSLFKFPTDKIGDFITYIADQNLFNPVHKWIESKPWDGEPRLQKLYDTVTARGESYRPEIRQLKETIIKRWLISAVAAAYSQNGIAAAGVLVFQGAQYLGKTKWFKSLVPKELDLIKDGMLLRPDDKDSVKQICSYWLVELGELDSTFRRSDIAQLKAFITKDSDVLRLAYAKRESHYARRTVFFGSVNPREYLHDPTGNRRFWTIECEKLDHSHDIDMQQLWAEVLDLYKGGEGFYLTPDEMEMLNASNDDFMALDPVEERILGKLDWDSAPATWRWAQASEVLVECGIDKPNKTDAATAATLIRSKNGDQSKRSNGKRLLLCPEAVRM
jgi:hypothetical protein